MVYNPQRAKRVAQIDGLQRRIEDTLDPLIGDARTVICLNVPFHTNIGDALIWLGTQAYLERKGIRIEYMASHVNVSLRTVRRCGSHLILLQGGGNFGDLWPVPHAVSERVVSTFPHHRVVLLPQSVHFRDPARLQQCQAIFARHADLHLCLREEASFAFCQRHFPQTVSYLCPDMAWNVGVVDSPDMPQESLLLLAREDRERKVDGAWNHIPADRRDWVGPFGERCMIAGFDMTFCRIEALRRRLYTAQGEHRLNIGRRLLGRYQALVTDRLHAHILALLMGKRHIVLDNSYGKIRHTYETWTHAFDEAMFLNDERYLDDHVERLLSPM